MDWTLVAIFIVAGLVLIVFVLVMLNRAWGNFPSRGGEFSSPTLPPSPSPLASATLPDSAPDVGLVPVIHPMVRNAVLSALERGGSPYSIYFVKEGESVYLVPTRIADPQQREVLTRMFTALNSDDDSTSISFGDIIRVLQELGRR
ncbi:hypothetical protein [Candidatus Oscillochloris fontis]|uniref:hypothetical protein n=1 Tax=Candidatus Oscillochloris fontis TaxID=2496868 RepID=UPI00101D8A65|nr:hypothetical protein [Candidatus Oscillochloris fontis]